MSPEGTPGAPPARPTVWVNFAASTDGRLAYAAGRRARLSDPADLRRVQALRADSDAILVGVGTVRLDDPSLRVHWEELGRSPGPAPARVVVDSLGRTPATAKVLDGSLPTIVAVSERSTRSFPPGVEVIVAGRERVDLGLLFARLAERGIRRLMIEGGSEVIASVLREGLFDRLTIYQAPVVIGGRSAPPIATGRETADETGVVRLELEGVERLGEGFVATYRPRLPDRT